MKWYERLKDKPWWSLTVALCIAVILYFLLQHLGSFWNLIKSIFRIISPLIVGLVIAYIIDPLVRLFERTLFSKTKNRSLARTFSIIVSVIVILIFIAAIMWLLIPQLIDSINMLIVNMGGYVQGLESWLKHLGGGFLAKYLANIDFENFTASIVKLLSGIVSGGSIIDASVSFGMGIVSFVISFILAIYYLFDKHRLIDLSKKFFRVTLKEKKYTPFMNFCSSCNTILVRYICCSLLEALMVGVANAIIMLIFRMPYVTIISIIVGITNLAPTFGPIVGAVIGGFLLLMINPVYTLIFVIAIIVLQTLDGYVVKPKLFAGTLGVSSLLILISIIILGKIFGIVGMLCAIPVAAIIENIFRNAIKTRSEKKRLQSFAGYDNPEE